MASKVYKIQEHVVPCQHIRQYPRATLDEQETVLHLAVKQYTPLDNPHPQKGDVTIIGAHANGFPKELYEPLWVDLHARAKVAGFRIRTIFIADVAWQGASSALNEDKLGDDPNWLDHSRDLLQLINHFRADIQRPIIGVGHSMGGCQIVQLSLMHPRLFETLILIDPVIVRFSRSKGDFSPGQASASRRDIWPSREAAAAGFKKSKFYQTWDPRVLDAWIQYGLRELPTKLYPKMPQETPAKNTNKELAPVTLEPTVAPEPARPVTLMTTKHQEVFTFLRPNYIPQNNPDAPGPHQVSQKTGPVTYLSHPDITPLDEPQVPFYRPEPVQTYFNLPFLRPSVLYIFGETSDVSPPYTREEKMATTGTGPNGSGGAAAGRVRSHVVKGVGHLIPMEAVGETADQAASWISAELARYKQNEAEHYKDWEGKPREERYQLSDRYLDEAKVPHSRRPIKQKL